MISEDTLDLNANLTKLNARFYKLKDSLAPVPKPKLINGKEEKSIA